MCVCCEKRNSPTHKIDIGRTIPSGDARFTVGGKLQLGVNAEQRSVRWCFRIEVADEPVLGTDLDVTSGAVGAVNEHRTDRRRRVKKDIKVLDLAPVKDAKGGGIPGPGNIPTGPGQSPPQKPGGQ